MFKYIEIVILAVVQGIAEFLPISSSAHLIIFRDILGVAKTLISQDLAMTFDVALHFGTLLAILLFFFKDFWKMFTKALTKGTKDKDAKLFYLIIVASIPAAVFGLVFEDFIESIFRNNFIIIGLGLIIMGLILNLTDKKGSSEKGIYEIKLKDAIVIGFGQILALIPGFSRSGSTTSAARARGIEREAATKFSFYLATPVIAGAALLEFIKADFSLIAANYQIFVIGIVVAFITGTLTIKFLLNYIKSHDYKVFTVYRVILGLAVIAYALFS